MMLAGTGRKSAFMLMCIMLDELGTAVLAAPIFGRPGGPVVALECY